MPPQARPPAIETETVELLDPQAASEAFRARAKARPQLRKLSDEAKKRGYTPHEQAEEAFGIRVKTRATGNVRPPSALGAKAVRTVEFELVGQSASKSGAEGAIATCVVKAGSNETAYDFLLEAPDGDFQRAQEFTLENNKVIEAHSWWSAWVGCLRSRCASTCLSSLFTCSGTWAAYFWCVAAACGGCVLRCSACATCDCSWWCRWAAGCCDR
jgi:hypothetical protein